MTHRSSFLLSCVLISTALVCGACGDDGGGGTSPDADTAVASDTPDIGDDTPSTDDTSTDGDTTTMADTALDDTAPAGCSEDDLIACAYPIGDLGYVERQGYSVTDPVTGRVLPVFVRVPQGDGPFPAVIWSHGGGFNDNGHLFNEAWGDALARHGFVVIHVAHVAPTTETGTQVCTLLSVPTGECVPDGDEDDSGLFAAIRAYDLAGVFDALPALSQWSVDNGGPALDLDHVAVAGWSAGARGPSLLFGAEVEPTASAPRFSMVRAELAAAVMLSPAGPGFGGYFDDGSENSWDGMRGPVFVATGVNDVKPLKPELTGDNRRVAFDAQPDDGARWLLYSNLPVGVGGHGTYDLADLASDDERLARFSHALRSSVLAFLDAHLREDEAARAWLDSGNALTLAGDAEVLNP